jgi:hypothetical protein
MGNSGSLAARNIRNIPDEVGCSSPGIPTVLQENHTSNLSEREIPKNRKNGVRKVGLWLVEIHSTQTPIPI